MSELRQRSKMAIFINIAIYLAVAYVYFYSKLMLYFLEWPIFVEVVVLPTYGCHYVVYSIIIPPVFLFSFLGFSLLYDWLKNFKSYRPRAHFIVFLALVFGSVLCSWLFSNMGILTDSLFTLIYSTALLLFAFTMLMAPVSSALTSASPYKKDSLPKGIYALPVRYSWESAEEGSLSMFHEESDSGAVSLSEDDGMLSIQEV